MIQALVSSGDFFAICPTDEIPAKKNFLFA